MAAGAEAAHGAATFPPFDPSLFQHQLVWLVISFAALYFLMSRVALPNVAAVLETRRATRQGDLDAAAETSAAAETARIEAERRMAEAKAGARKIVDDMRAEMSAALAADKARAEAVLNERLEAAQKRIAAARAEAMADVDQIADELAREIVGKLSVVRSREEMMA